MSPKGKREQLLDALERLYGQEGLTLAQVAQEAGVSRMTLYRHFPNKEALYEALGRERGVEVDAGEDLRARIVQAAKEAFVREGFGVSMEAIAADAGVGVATLYRQFGDKTGLIVSVRDQLRPEFFREQDLGLPPSGHEDFEQELAEFVRCLLELMSNSRDLLTLVLRERMSEGEGILGHRPGRTLDRIRDFFEEHAKQGWVEGDPRHLAIVLMSTIGGLAWMLPTLQGEDWREEHEALGALIARLFLRGVYILEEEPHEDDS